MVQPWETLSSRLVFDHPWYKLRQDRVRLPNGRILDDYFVSVRQDIVLIFALTTEGHLLMVRQYKHGAQQITLELPGGALDETPGDPSGEIPGVETPLQAAHRELREETGYACASLRLVAQVFDDVTKNTNSIHVFLGQDARRVGSQSLDENEAAAGMEVVLVTLPDILSRIRQGQIVAQSSVMAIYRVLDELQPSLSLPNHGDP